MSLQKQPTALQSFVMGGVLGVDALALCLAISTIFFPGPLAAGLGIATAIFTVSTIVITLVLYRYSALRPILGIAQDICVPLLAPSVAAAALLVDGPIEAKVTTAFVIIGLSTILTGFTFWLVGHLRLGRIIRMFPFSVSAGFLAASGFVLVFSGFSILTEAGTYRGILQGLQEEAAAWSVFTAVLLALILCALLALGFGIHWVILALGAFLVGFYVFLYGQGWDVDTAKALGLLPDIGAREGSSFSLIRLDLVDWQLVLQASIIIPAVVLLNLIAVLLNTSGVEIASKKTIDENKELRITGLTNLFLGLTGGTSSFIQSGASVMAVALKLAPGPFIYGNIAVMVAGAFFAERIVTFVPTFVAAGLLIFIGLSMLMDWLFQTYKRIVLTDWLIVVSIVSVTAVLGILPAIGFGLLLAALTFVAGFVRLPIIRAKSTVDTRRSLFDRPASDAGLLSEHGKSVEILQLQGAFFFGSVEQLIVSLKGLKEPLHSLIIDFSEVSAYDSSGCAALQKLGQLLEPQGTSIYLTGLSAPLSKVLQRWGLDFQKTFKTMANLDDAIEIAETQLLDQLREKQEVIPIAELLNRLGNGHPRLNEIILAAERVELAPGDALMRTNSLGFDIYVVETGRLDVVLSRPPAAPILVRSIGPGAIVGEVGHVLRLARGADVVARRSTSLLRLSEETLARFERDDRDLAALVSQILARSLAEKLTQTNVVVTRSGKMA